MTSLRIGIDVGGTFTDAVLLDCLNVAAEQKVPTRSDALLETVLTALDALRLPRDAAIDQITVSTTLITNAILQKRLTPTELLLIPGYGMRLDALAWPVPYRALQGQLDFRGREIAAVETTEVQEEARRLSLINPCSSVAIVGKFSHRNNAQELGVEQILKKTAPQLRTTLGHRWGGANIYRRALTAYLNLACQDEFAAFADGLRQAVRQRGFTAPLQILKADGGVLPLEDIRAVDTVYSGPAASMLGALADSGEDMPDSYVVIDVGGTSTDMGLILDRVPMWSAKGAKIGGFSTQIRAMAVRSLAMGGDSVVQVEDGQVRIQPYRAGLPCCRGGPELTPTDAMCYLGIVAIGDQNKAAEGLARQCPVDQTPESLSALAQEILNVMSQKITDAVMDLEREWRDEPTYKIWQVLHPQQQGNFPIWLSGGPAPGLLRDLTRQSGRAVRSGTRSGLANAIGAALARPAFSRTLHLDTVVGRYRIAETGEQGVWQGSPRPHKEITRLMEEIMTRESERRGLAPDDWQKEVFDFFPVVDGYSAVGQVVRGSWHVPAGIMGRVNQ
ncbi:MAG: hydantoinase/oxoprolinase family protein [Peptococcaceae bacterium]|nr:hydantoinase/oxoprolinase family protein [Peptococcaceae bacterium]